MRPPLLSTCLLFLAHPSYIPSPFQIWAMVQSSNVGIGYSSGTVVPITDVGIEYLSGTVVPITDVGVEYLSGTVVPITEIPT